MSVGGLLQVVYHSSQPVFKECRSLHVTVALSTSDVVTWDWRCLTIAKQLNVDFRHLPDVQSTFASPTQSRAKVVSISVISFVVGERGVYGLANNQALDMLSNVSNLYPGFRGCRELCGILLMWWRRGKADLRVHLAAFQLVNKVNLAGGEGFQYCLFEIRRSEHQLFGPRTTSFDFLLSCPYVLLMLFRIQLHGWWSSFFTKLNFYEEGEFADLLSRSASEEFALTDLWPDANSFESGLFEKLTSSAEQNAFVVVVASSSGNFPATRHAVGLGALQEKDTRLGWLRSVEDKASGCDVRVAWIRTRGEKCLRRHRERRDLRVVCKAFSLLLG